MVNLLDIFNLPNFTKLMAATVVTASVSFLPATANAAFISSVTFTFDENDATLNPTLSKTVDGVTITLSNPKNSGFFPADNDGLFLSKIYDSSTLGLSQFDISFNRTVRLDSYEISRRYTRDYISLSNPNGIDSTGNSTSVGVHDFNNSFFLFLGQTSTLNVPFFRNSENLGLKSITVFAVPEPFTILGSGIAVGFGTYFKRKMNKKKTNI